MDKFFEINYKGNKTETYSKMKVRQAILVAKRENTEIEILEICQINSISWVDFGWLFLPGDFYEAPDYFYED
jgi:hypothetical protein